MIVYVVWDLHPLSLFCIWVTFIRCPPSLVLCYFYLSLPMKNWWWCYWCMLADMFAFVTFVWWYNDLGKDAKSDIYVTLIWWSFLLNFYSHRKHVLHFKIGWAEICFACIIKIGWTVFLSGFALKLRLTTLCRCAYSGNVPASRFWFHWAYIFLFLWRQGF